MAQEKLRSEIKEEDKWDVSVIYANDELWYKDFDLACKEVDKATNYKDKLLSSADNLLEYIKYDEKTDRLLSKLYYYANLNHDADTLNNNYKIMYNKINDLFNKYGELSSFVFPCILNTDYKILDEYINSNEELKEYKFDIDDIYRFKKHTLSEEKEILLNTLSKNLSNDEETYEALTDSDFEFDNIIDEEGNEQNFNESSYAIYIRSEDRNTRIKAFNLLFNKYKEFRNTLASTFSGNVEKDVVISKIRNYDSALSASLYQDNIDISVYDNLIKTINDNMNTIYKYYDLKKNMLNLDELHMYDVYAPLVNKNSKNYTFEEAKGTVINALSVLGDDYVNNLNKAFKEKWIDKYHSKGKRSGAYSSGFYDINPYVLLNFEGKIEDVSTLAHELGHSMHTYYSCNSNPYHLSSYRIFVAEVASTVNELLLSYYLLNNSKDKDEKLFVLNHLMELFRTTLYRQTMFAEFEKLMHEKREQKEVLTSKLLSDSYYNLVKKYFGKNVVIDDLIRYEYSRIPHFYYNFYVYKYATGLSAACYIVDGIMNNKKDALNNYLNFLKTGGSMYPVDELKVAGVDINNSKVIESAINMFDNTIDEFIKLYNS